MSGSKRLALTVASALLAVTACASGGADPASTGGAEALHAGAEPQTSERTTTTTARPAESASPLSPEEAALAGLLLEEPPLPGFRRDDERLDTGPLDLEAAARAESDVPAERALLETRHFVRGSSRGWTNDRVDVVYLAVYTFAGADDAALYLRDGTQTLLARGASSFEVPAIPGALGFTAATEGPDGSFTTHAVAFTSGERWVLAIVGSRGTSLTPDDARTVALAQATRLTTSTG